MIQTSVQHTVKMQLPSWTWDLHQGADRVQQKGYENYLITRIPAAPALLLLLLLCFSFSWSWSFPPPSFSHISRTIKAALPDYDWQKRPIPSANHPQDFQGPGAVVMSSSQCDVTHEYIPTEANSAISCIPLTPRWLIRCSLWICIIFHCTVGLIPMKFERKILLCSYDTVPEDSIGWKKKSSQQGFLW